MRFFPLVLVFIVGLISLSTARSLTVNNNSFYKSLVEKCEVLQLNTSEQFAKQDVFSKCTDWASINQTTTFLKGKEQEVLCLIYYDSLLLFCTDIASEAAKLRSPFTIKVDVIVPSLKNYKTEDICKTFIPENKHFEHHVSDSLKRESRCMKVCESYEVNLPFQECSLGYYFANLNVSKLISQKTQTGNSSSNLKTAGVSSQQQNQKPDPNGAHAIEEPIIQKSKKPTSDPGLGSEHNKMESAIVHKQVDTVDGHSGASSQHGNRESVPGSPSEATSIKQHEDSGATADQPSGDRVSKKTPDNKEHGDTQALPIETPDNKEHGDTQAVPIEIPDNKEHGDTQAVPIEIPDNKEHGEQIVRVETVNEIKANTDKPSVPPQEHVEKQKDPGTVAEDEHNTAVKTVNEIKANTDKPSVLSQEHVGKQKDPGTVAEDEHNTALEGPLVDGNGEDDGRDGEYINLNDNDDDLENKPPVIKNNAEKKEKPSTLDDTPISFNTSEELDGESYFFSYFMVVCIIFVLGYVAYHNRQKVLALVLEGKRGKRQHRGRRPNSANYHKLDSNLEEAISSTCTKSTSNVIY